MVRLGSTNFVANLSIFGPTGVLVGQVQASDTSITFTATNSGTFTVLVSSYWGYGDYVLHLARVPGDFTLPPGKQGGPLSEGYNEGTIALADLARWTLPAQAGDRIVLRLGAQGFMCNLDVFGPQGNVVATGGNGADVMADLRVTDSGVYTVLVSSYLSGGTGPYALYLAHIPNPFTVPPGHSGGSLGGQTDYQGAIAVGEVDRWQFTACTGDHYALTLTPTNFFALIRLYGPDGVFLAQDSSTNTLILAGAVTNCGTFTALVSSYWSGQAGAYHLQADRLSDGLKVCPPRVAGGSLTVQGIGGAPNTPVVLYNAPLATTPAASWRPVSTNSFDRMGIFSYRNAFDPGAPQGYFRYRTP